jgi:hypothetical protein
MLFQHLYCSIFSSSRFQTAWMFGMAALYFQSIISVNTEIKINLKSVEMKSILPFVKNGSFMRK